MASWKFVPYDVKEEGGGGLQKLRHFDSQGGLSSMLWAYAKVGTSKSNSALFELAAGDEIVAMNDLVDFWP